jgi:cyclopropane-fatty-acyl-phospholipid synthase
MIRRISKEEALPRRKAKTGDANDFAGDPRRPGAKSRASALERRLIDSLITSAGHPAVAVRLWDGETFAPHDQEILGTLHIDSRSALWRLVTDAGFQFGELYSAGEIRVTGSFVDVIAEIFRALRAMRGGSRLSGLAGWLRRPRPTTREASRDNIYHHYDIGNDFYRLWLDREHLAYTCAYFARPEMTIEQAQSAKLEHVCRKLRLSPDLVVIEAGCGWGGLALYMAKQYGVRVRAYNISREQIAYARERAASEGLDERVEFIEDDWRNAQGPCDVFVSVGMLEHVGRRNYRELGRVIDRCLTDQGRGLIHTIGQNQSQPFSPWIERRIFPGAYTPTIAEMMDIFEPQDLSVLDLENLRLHYAETLRHWLARFEQNVDRVRSMFDDRFIRMWRMYLAGSVAAFEASYYQLYQVVFNRANCNDVPMTREHLYAAAVEHPLDGEEIRATHDS